jgi:tetratricopeptide (TPR) repeat protein
LSDLFDLQDRIALETTKLIAPSVRERELRRAMRKHPQNMTAYELVLQALGPLHDLQYAAFSRSRVLLLKAIELDAEYAPAHACLAHWHCYRTGQLWSTDISADAREAERLAANAIRLDHCNATALAVHAHVKWIVYRDYAASRDGFDRALTESPNSSFAWTLSAVTESCTGRGPEGVAHAQNALRLSPRDNFIHYTLGVLAQSHFVAGDYQEAVRFGRLAFERNDLFTANLRILGASVVETGQLDAARVVVAQHLRTVPGFSLRAWCERTWLSVPACTKVADNLRRAGMPD